MNSRTTNTMILTALAASVLFALAPVMAAEGLQTKDRPALSTDERKDLAALARSAVRAGIPEEEVEIIVGRGLERGVDVATLGSFLETAVQTKQAGLPVRPVLDRIQQGLSKNIPPARIDEASKRLATGLAQARQLVDGLLQKGMAPGHGDARDAALESVARAREQSIPADAILSVGEKAAAEGLTVSQFDRAARTFSFMTGAGMPVASANRIVLSGVDHGFSERDFGKLERNVNEMVRQGRSMDDIVGSAEREVREHRERPSENRMRDRAGSRDAGGRGGRGR